MKKTKADRTGETDAADRMVGAGTETEDTEAVKTGAEDRRPESSAPVQSSERDRVIIRTSITGIIANVLLAVFKAVVGILSNSIAVVLDAVNNLSDAMSSVITIVGTRLAGKAPDRKHPMGYGRVEYLSSAIISLIVLYAGISSLKESVGKIIHPETADYSALTLVIIAVAVVVKIVLGRYVKRVGEKVNSDSLVNSGEDATLDSIISASTLAAAFIYMFFHISLESWLGAVISVVIIKSGIEMLRDTLSQILGERVDTSLARTVKEKITEVNGVYGAYDLVLHSYGPDKWLGSVHIEVKDTCTADEIDQLEREISNKIYGETGVILTGIGIYSMNTKNDSARKIQTRVTEIVMSHEHVLQIHGFYLDEKEKTIRFDMVIDFFVPDRDALVENVRGDVGKEFPGYQVVIQPDADVSD
ncbi:MAG: cation diffusion facilitator family transporter [Bilifractor sp.]|jgi:cation diffusion facilitator family transporter